MLDDAQGFRDRMACLADESRFRIVLSLAAAEQCVSELARNVGLSQSCTTRHLQSLARRGLVQGSRHGRQVVFALRFDAPEIRVVLQAFDPDDGGTALAGGSAHLERAPSAATTRRAARLDARSQNGRAAEPRLPAPTPAAIAPVVLELGHAEAPDETVADPPDAGAGDAVRPMRRSDLEDYLL